MLENERHDSERNIDQPGKSRSPAIDETPAATAAAPRTRTRRRTAKPAAGAAQAAPDTQTPAVEPAAEGTSAAAPSQAAPPGPADGAAVPAADPAAGAGEAGPARRTRRTATRAAGKSAGGAGGGDGSEPAPPEQAATSQAGAVATPFAAPAAQTTAPSPGAGDIPDSAARPGRSQTGPQAVPAATFQPPQVIFQPPSTSAAAPSREAEPAGDTPAERADADADAEGTARRRRRRGSRSRAHTAETEPGQDAGSGGEAATGAQAETGEQAPAAAAKADADAPAADADGDEAAGGGSRKRRRKRRRGSAADADQAGPDDPPNTVVHVRPTRSGAEAPADEVQVVRGSTRLEAKRQRRKEGRDSGRRRPPVITESEFLARREAVDRVMVVRQRGEWTQIAVLEDGVLVEHYVDRGTHQSLVGNVYLGKVQNVLPSMEAAFVDIGKGRNAVLYAGEVNFDASGLEGESKRIESALKSGQSVLVQVTKDPVGHKGARLTSQASLPGRYLVYVPGRSMMGISRKLPDTERTRLKQILKQVMPESAGVIVRTAAEGASEEELAHDVARLSAQWASIEQKAASANPPELLYSEPDLTIRVVRDIFNEDFTKLVVAGDQGWDLVDEYVHYVAPHLSDRLQHWQSDADVFAHYRIDEQLAKALERKVWLPSGGSLVIDNTEAMTVIDVNTGKFTGQGGNLEETVTRNNLEAAEEIVRQLRLRDVGGIIVIDFIDMVLESNRELVLRRLLECLARDRTKHQVAEVTSLGLVQMTRKRVGSGLLEAFSEPCECCNGRGLLVSLDGAEHSAHSHRGRADGAAAKDGKAAKESKTAKDGKTAKAGKDGKGQRRGKADRDDQAERKATVPAGKAQASIALASIAQASGAADSVSGNNDVTAGSGTDEGTAVTPAGGDAVAGQPADAPAPAGRRRRRAATREPGPPDSATGPGASAAAPPGSAAGPDGQAPAEAPAAASV
jgi:ribonuclease E